MDRKLIDYLPAAMREYKEMQAIMAAVQIEFELLESFVEQALDNTFVETANEYGVGRLEDIFGIKRDDTISLDGRRFTLRIKLSEVLPVTMKTLKAKLTSICGEEGYFIDYVDSEYKLVVKIDLTSKENFNTVREFLVNYIPANILMDLDLMYNTYTKLKGLTHDQLTKYTHYHLRNEVL